MKYKNIEFSLRQSIALIVYKLILVWLPASTTPIIGKLCKMLRYLCCKNIFLYCGKNVNIERELILAQVLE
jgi:maltose O-acetyltransferase